MHEAPHSVDFSTMMHPYGLACAHTDRWHERKRQQAYVAHGLAVPQVVCVSAAMWRYVVNDSGKITDIYFLTQLTPDEKLSMVSHCTFHTTTSC